MKTCKFLNFKKKTALLFCLPLLLIPNHSNADCLGKKLIILKAIRDEMSDYFNAEKEVPTHTNNCTASQVVKKIDSYKHLIKLQIEVEMSNYRFVTSLPTYGGYDTIYLELSPENENMQKVLIEIPKIAAGTIRQALESASEPEIQFSEYFTIYILDHNTSALSSDHISLKAFLTGISTPNSSYIVTSDFLIKDRGVVLYDNAIGKTLNNRRMETSQKVKFIKDRIFKN